MEFGLMRRLEPVQTITWLAWLGVGRLYISILTECVILLSPAAVHNGHYT